MNHRLIRLVLLVTLLVPALGHGQFITWDGDPNTALYDPNTSLNWVPLTATSGWTYTSVQAALQSGGTYEGFRFATFEEMDSFTRYMGYIDGATQEQILATIENLGDSLGFISVIGGTWVTFPPTGEEMYLPLVHNTMAIAPTGVENTWSYLSYQHETDEFGSIFGFSLDRNPAYSMLAEMATSGWPGAFMLVRETTPEVPEPRTLGLIAIGFLGVALLIRRRRG